MQQMKIPTSMQIGKHEYSINPIKYMGTAGEMGRTYYQLKTIMLGKHYHKSTAPFSAEDINETFWHEVTHAVLFELDNPLHKDEKFVTAFSACLSKAITSAKFE